MNKVILLISFSILLLVPAIPQNVLGHGTIDQINSGSSTGSHPIDTSSGSGVELQSFTPSVSPLVAFDIELLNPTSSSITIPSLFWEVRQADLSLLISSGSVPNVVLSPGTNTVHIDLPSPSPVNIGSLHGITISGSIVSPPTLIEWAYTGNNYALGAAAIDGTADFTKDFIFTTYAGTPGPITCGPKTFPNSQNQCVPDLTQICGQGTTPNFNTIMCIATNMGNIIGGAILDIDNYALFVAAIGVNPVFTILIGITLAGVAGQAVWFIHKRRKEQKD